MAQRKNSKAFNDLSASLKEAIAFKKGKGKGRVHRRKVEVAPLPSYSKSDVKRIREDLNLSQKTFAELLGVSIKAVEAWEAGRTEPNGSAQRMLSIIDRDVSSLEKYKLLQIS